jgi:uncharacterized protein Usg
VGSVKHLLASHNFGAFDRCNEREFPQHWLVRNQAGTFTRQKVFSVKAGDRKDTMSSLELALKGYRLTTAEILYRRPDHPALIQSYVWQEYDLSPKFPVLNTFLRFWESKLDGKLHSVWVAATGIIQPTELKYYGGEFKLH